MGLSSYSTPADVGVFCVILVNTAISISIFKEIFLSILHVMGIHMASREELSLESSDSVECRRTHSELYVEEFHSRTPAIRYDSMFIQDCPKEECSVCLSEFKQYAEVNHLSCGHVFHKSCLEKWLKYWNVTCPLCRIHMMPQEVEDDACPM
ncbi:probable E3 ubiquitin-protein ligase XERICO [Olea europaea var. sylvestris]|uniref:probable E3 ubiquitin-protein ligase XERICO n=1 Tax=Olea europaea var. sylvestris TaxID=158386 RepID=UPI000C1D8868|nr:probable E3 ubiquitin-protein ligase XERICO [Olea europaea var. sylvestris]XP_022865710.1 probable E3 ubiquitin-protein ligase XERICO [Olea europaea var. sylvestris]